MFSEVMRSRLGPRTPDTARCLNARTGEAPQQPTLSFEISHVYSVLATVSVFFGAISPRSPTCPSRVVFAWLDRCDDNDNDTDNDTLRKVPHPSNEGPGLTGKSEGVMTPRKRICCTDEACSFGKVCTDPLLSTVGNASCPEVNSEN